MAKSNTTSMKKVAQPTTVMNMANSSGLSLKSNIVEPVNAAKMTLESKPVLDVNQQTATRNQFSKINMSANQEPVPASKFNKKAKNSSYKYEKPHAFAAEQNYLNNTSNAKPAESSEQIGFSISGSTNISNIQKNFMDKTSRVQRGFTAAKKAMGGWGSLAIVNGANRHARLTMSLAAVPESAEGDWANTKRKYVIGGNWKSNGTKEFLNTFPEGSINPAEFDPAQMEVCMAPADIHLTMAADKFDTKKVNVMAQDVSQYGMGAYTGNVSAEMLSDIGIQWTLTGHSERRTLFHETDEDIAVKTKYAIDKGMTVMVCIGEQLEERESGKTNEVNARQLKAVAEKLEEKDWDNVVIAYEPVWAIGTGKVATPEQAQETHAEIRKWLAENVSPQHAHQTRILYGGSVKGANCKELIDNPDIDGFLVGGASMLPEFKDIIETAWADYQTA